MVSEKIKLLKIITKSSNVLEIILEINNQRQNYRVNVIDSHELFGLEFPNQLIDLLNNFPNTESQNLISKVKQKYFELKKSPVLQAA